MRGAILAALALALSGPAEACEFSAADFRSLYDRAIAPQLNLRPVSEYNCQYQGDAAFCDMVTPDKLSFFVEDAATAPRASLLVMSGGDLTAAQARAVIARLAALCSPLGDAAARDAALAHAEDAPRGAEGTQVIIDDVSYRLLGDRSVRIKDRRLPDARGINTSDDE